MGIFSSTNDDCEHTEEKRILLVIINLATDIRCDSTVAVLSDFV